MKGYNFTVLDLYQQPNRNTRSKLRNKNSAVRDSYTRRIIKRLRKQRAIVLNKVAIAMSIELERRRIKALTDKYK